MMTPDEVKTRVDKLREVAGSDPERDHAEEDSIYYDVLYAIANRETDGDAASIECAQEAIKAYDIYYPKWYA